MCIIQGDVLEVTSTKIFVAPLQDGQRQLTVYSNKVSMDKAGGAMILPFPQGAGCELVDLSAYTDLFTHLDLLCWPQVKSRSIQSYSLSAVRDSMLEVKQSGSYKASIVPELKDLSRINPSVFSVNPKVREFLREKYPTGYGFVVCQLDKNKEYHPFGYIHSLILPSQQIFIPTMHYHTHIMGYEHDEKGSEPSADWDHDIYTLNTPLEFVPSRSRNTLNKQPVINRLRMEKLPAEVVTPQTVYAYKINDYTENHDLCCVKC